MSDSTKRTLLASPRGYCAGVDRAVVTVEKALEHFGAPVYMRKQIVHNKHVVEVLEERGAVFVDEESWPSADRRAYYVIAVDGAGQLGVPSSPGWARNMP